jgi:hypothetical protein
LLVVGFTTLKPMGDTSFAPTVMIIINRNLTMSIIFKKVNVGAGSEVQLLHGSRHPPPSRRQNDLRLTNGDLRILTAKTPSEQKVEF